MTHKAQTPKKDWTEIIYLEKIVIMILELVKSEETQTLVDKFYSFLPHHTSESSNSHELKTCVNIFHCINQIS